MTSAGAVGASWAFQDRGLDGVCLLACLVSKKDVWNSGPFPLNWKDLDYQITRHESLQTITGPLCSFSATASSYSLLVVNQKEITPVQSEGQGCGSCDLEGLSKEDYYCVQGQLGLENEFQACPHPLQTQCASLCLKNSKTQKRGGGSSPLGSGWFPQWSWWSKVPLREKQSLLCRLRGCRQNVFLRHVVRKN